MGDGAGLEDTASAHYAWRQSLCKKLSNEGFKSVEYVVVSQSEKTVAAQGGLSPADSLEIGEIKGGRLMLRVSSEHDQNQNRVQEKVFWLKIKARKSAWVIVRDVQAGDKVRRRDVAFQEIDIAPFTGLLNDQLLLNNPIGQRARNQLKKGAVITDNSLLSSPHMQRGTVVDVTIARGPVSIEAKGEVLTDVYDVQKVHVKLEYNDVQMLGALTSDGNVLVQL